MARLQVQSSGSSKYILNWLHMLALFHFLVLVAAARNIIPRSCGLEQSGTSIAASTSPATVAGSTPKPSASTTPAASTPKTSVSTAPALHSTTADNTKSASVASSSLTTLKTTASTSEVANSTVTVSPIEATGTGTFVSTASNGVPFLVSGFITAGQTSMVSVLGVITTTCVPTTTVTAMGNNSLATVFGQCGDGIGPQVTPVINGSSNIGNSISKAGVMNRLQY